MDRLLTLPLFWSKVFKRFMLVVDLLPPRRRDKSRSLRDDNANRDDNAKMTNEKSPGRLAGAFSLLFLLYQGREGKYANFVTMILKELRWFRGLTSEIAEVFGEIIFGCASFIE
jgi:hypothetical protein